MLPIWCICTYPIYFTCPCMHLQINFRRYDLRHMRTFLLTKNRETWLWLFNYYIALRSVWWTSCRWSLCRESTRSFQCLWVEPWITKPGMAARAASDCTVSIIDLLGHETSYYYLCFYMQKKNKNKIGVARREKPRRRRWRCRYGERHIIKQRWTRAGPTWTQIHKHVYCDCGLKEMTNSLVGECALEIIKKRQGTHGIIIVVCRKECGKSCRVD